MCDCFHLAFPNWHGSPGTGAGRRLKGPEPDTVDDSICEEPSEFIEGERPRPQGSSPVDEYPETDKYTDIDKQGGGGSGKKGKRGFGSLFEKCSPAKMSKLESPESGVIVKMAKETCAEGLVVSGGGKEGIFIKEVRPESPASKLLSVHEGDQILSATVYFDDVKYEDALQILEHAQPYKMELLLKRKPIKTSTLESEPALEFTQVEEGSSLEMRGHSKPKRHGDRISWPKFPSFSKSRKSHFKRSHSTSDADDQRKLELSPTTSDTESPIKSQEAVKGRTKKHKIKLSSVKMMGRKSRSVEHPDQDTDILTVECVQVMEIQQSQDDIYSPDGLESTSGETPQVYVLESESEKMESTKIKNECTLPDLTGSETKKHKVELIRLDKTLKTTDLTVAFADQESPSTKKSPEGKKMKKENKERSELKFRFKGNEKKDKHKQDIPVKSSPKSTKTPGAFIITSDLSAHDNTLLSPTVVSHTKLKERQLPIDINTRLIYNESSGKTLPSTDMEMSIPKVALSLDMSDIGLIRKSPQIGQEQDLKETYVKTNLNAQEMLAKVTSFTMEPDLQMEIQALKLPTETSIDDVLVQIGTRTATKFKLPRMDHADFVTDKPIKMTDVKIVEMDVKSLTVEDKGLTILPNRDDIEIPGLEDASSTGTKTPVIKQPKTAFTLPVEVIQAQTVQMVIDVDRVKEAVSKLPGFKLPKGDIAGLPAHQEITKTYVNAERVNVTVDATLSKITDIKAQLDTYVKKTDINASTEKLSMSSVTTIKLPKNQLSDLGAHEPITMTEIDHTKTKEEAGRTNEVEIKIELHKREDVEIPGMETIQQNGSPNQVENKKETGKILEPKLAGPVPEWPTITAEEKSVIPYTKGLDKKSKKAKTSMPGFGKTQVDIRLQDIGIGLPKRDTSAQKEDEVKDESTALHLEMKMPGAEIKLSKEPDSEYSIIKVKTPETDLQTSTIGTLTSGKMAEVPSVDIKGAGMDIDVQSVDVGRFKMPTLKFPKFEAASPNVTVEVPYVEKDIKVHGTEIPELKLTISAINIEKPSVDLTGPSVDVYVKSKKREIVTLPEVKVEVQPTSVELKVPSGEFEIPEEAATEVDLKMKKPRLSFGWFSKPEAKAPEVDVSLTKMDILLPEGKVEVKEPDVEIKAPEVQIGIKHDIELEGQGRTFKLTTFGLSLPKVKGPEIGLSLSKTDVDVDLPEGRADLQLPDVEVGVPSVEVEIPDSGSKDIDVKMRKPRMSFPKFGFSKPEVKAREVDINIPEVDVSLPEGKVEFKESEVEMKTPDIQVDVKDTIGSPSRFKMPTLKFPKFGAASPNVTIEVPDLDKDIKVHGTEIPEPKLTISTINIEKSSVDLKSPSIDVDVNLKKHEIVTLPEIKMEVQPPSIELKLPSGEVEIPEGAATEIDGKMKKPRLSFGWFSKPEVKAPEVDVCLTKVDISLPEGKVEVKEPDVEIKAPEVQIGIKHDIELEGQGRTFKLPTFGLLLPKVKGPEIGLNLSKTDVDVDLPEGRADLQLPDVEVGVPSVEVEIPESGSKDIDVKMRKPRMSFPKFGFSKPEVKVREVDINIPEVDVSLPEGKVEFKESEVEMKTPDIQVDVKDTIGSPSRFKMPTLKFPKFGAASPNVTIEVPDLDKDIKVHGTEIPEPKLTISAIDIEKSSVDLKGPSIDVDVNRKKREIVTLPEVKMEVQPPSIELKLPSGEVQIPEGAATEIDGKMKKPRMSFGWFSKPEAKAPEVDVSLTKVDILLPEGKVEVKEPDVEMKSPEVQIEMKHDIELEGQGRTFKLPTFGLLLPKVKGPEIGLNLSKTYVDVDLPEGRADLQLPDVEVGVPSVEVEIPESGSKDIDVKMRKPRMSFPKFGFSKPEVKAREVDINIPEVDVSLPEGKVEFKQSEVEIKTPDIQVDVKDTIGSPSRFKMPTLKFPKFGAASPNVTIEVPDLDKDIKVHGTEIPEPKLTISAIDIEKSSVDLKGPSIDVDVNRKKREIVTLPEVKMEVQPPSIELKLPSGEVQIPEGAATEIDGKMKKPRMSFGWFSKPEAKAPEVDVSLTKVDILLPEGKVEVKEPDVEMKSPEVQIEMKHDIELEGQGRTFKLPTFGLLLPKVKGPEIGLNLSKTDVDVDLPKGRADLQLPDVEVGVPSVEVEIPESGSKDIDVKMRKPRMSFPKFGFSKPEVKVREVDINIPEVDVSLPEGKVEFKESEVEMKTPDIQVDVKDTIGSPSRFKMPTLKFPKFGAASPNVTIEVPDLDKDIKVHGTEIPEPKLTISAIDIEKSSVDLKGPSIDVDVNRKKREIVTLPEVKMEVQPPSIELKLPSGEVQIPEGAATEIDGKMKKPRMSFGWFSKPEAKAPEVDVSLTKVDILLPEGKVEVKEPDVEMKSPEVQMEMKHDIDLEGQGRTFKLPTFGLLLPKVKGPEIGLNLSKTDVDVDLPEGRADLQLPDVEVGVPFVEVEIPESGSKDIDVKMKKPRMSFPKFGFSKPEVKAREVDINIPEVDVSLPEGKVEFKESEVEMKTPDIQVDVKDTIGSPSRFKMPTLKFPKFGAASPNVTIEVPDLDKDIKVHGTEIPEPKLTISAIDIEKSSVDLKGPSIDVDVNRKKREIVTLPEVKMEVQPSSIELKLPSGEVQIPEGAATEIDGKMKKPRMSFGWFSKPEAKAPEVDVSLTKVDILLPEGKVEVKEPDVEMKSPEVQIEMKHDIELEGQGRTFKLPTFGLLLPKVKGPEIGLNLSKTDVDVDLPEGRADHQLPDVEVGVPSVEVEIPESGSKDIDVKMKKPRMSFPKFGFSKPEVKAREVDINIPEVDVSLPEGKVEFKESEVEMKTPDIQVDVKDTIGSPSRFKMPTLKFPKFGAASPNVTIEVPDLDKDIKVHGTEIPEPKLTISAIDIEKSSVDLKGPSIDVDVNRKKREIVTLPEVKMEVQPPSIELKLPSGEVQIPEGAATEIDGKMKKPRMSFGWFSKPEAKAPEVDVSLTKVDILLPEGKVEVKEPDVEMKSPEVQNKMKHDIELEGQGRTFKLPTFGLLLPKVKGPEIGLNLSKTDVDVDLPEGRADHQLPDVEVGVPSVEVEIQEVGSKDIDVKMKKPQMSFPKFGFSKPEVKAPEVDINIPEVDISLPEGKVEVKEPEVEMNTPEIQVDVKDIVGSPSRFKMPTFKFPKFGAVSPNVTIEVPDLEKDIKVLGTEIPEPKLTISAINIEKPSVDLKGQSIDVDVIDVDVNLKKHGIVTLPEVKMEIQPPSIELKVPSGEAEIPEGAATEIDVKMKKPWRSFGWFSKPEVKAPEVDVILTKVGISLPEGKVEVKEPDVEMKAPEVQVEMKHDIELEGQGSKLPTFGLSLPKVKGPEIGLSLSKTDVDIDLPEGRADLQLPDLEVGVSSVEVEIPEAGSKDIDVKMKKPQMSFPKFRFSKPEVNVPEVDINLPEVDISLPEGKVEVKEPEVEMKTPEIQVDVKDTVGSPSRFKVPTLKFPKFGAASPNVTIEVPDLDKDIKVHGTEIPEPKLKISAINIDKPSVDLKSPSIDVDVNRKKRDIFTLPEVKTEVQPPSIELKLPSGEAEIPEGAAIEIDVKMKKPWMSFGRFSKPEVKAPEVDISLTKVDISLPEGKVEVKEPDVEMKSPEVQMGMKHDIEIQGQGSKFKLPKFGLSLPKVKGPEIGLSLSKTDVDVDLPEGRADLQLPDVEVSVPSVEVEIPESGSKGIDVKMKKPRMSFPKFGFSKPEVKAREVDINIPEVDVSLPEGKVEVKEPDVEMKTPDIQVDVKDTIGSPSRFIMPTFKFPKFGASSPNVKIQVSDLEKDIKVHGTEIPKVTISAINIEKPSVDLKGPSIDADVNRKKLEMFTLPEIKTKVQPPSIELKVPSGEVQIPEGAATEIDVKMKKPRMSFGWFSKPEVKAPEVDISLPEVDISLPEGKVEVKEPAVEIKTPDSQVEMKNEGSSVDGKLETPDMEAKTNEIGVKKPLISFPKIVFSRSEMTAPEIGVIPPNADISLPEGKVVKVPEVKIKAPEIEVDIKDVVGSPSRFKMSTFKFPKFGATSKVVVDVSDKEKDIDVPGVEILDQVLGVSFPVDLTEPGDTVDLKGCSEVQLHVAGSERPSVDEGMAIADVDVHDVDISKLTIDDKGHGSPRRGQGSPSKGQGSPRKFKLPTFKMPRLSSSKSKPKNEHEHDDICPNVILDNYEIQVEPQGPEKSPKLTLATFGEVLRSIDVEFDVPTLEDVEEKLTGSREEITASRKTELNAQPSAETQSVHEEEEAKEKSKFVWFKFPTFGLSSPSESAKILEKETSEKEASEKSPAGDSVEQDASLTFSVQSSDAFADISSTVTSEQVGPSLAFPTKVTVKYSDPIATEIQGNIITSTARTKMISFEPYLAEKVTIPMSSGASSSSVDTLKLESGTHIITSNIQAIPDTQKATLLTDFGLQTGTAGASYASWSVDDTNKIKSDGQTVIKRHVVRKMSGTDRETVVITLRAEPISDETASSIKQMKETMHSEKMKFFDGAELE